MAPKHPTVGTLIDPVHRKVARSLAEAAQRRALTLDPVEVFTTTNDAWARLQGIEAARHLITQYGLLEDNRREALLTARDLCDHALTLLRLLDISPEVREGINDVWNALVLHLEALDEGQDV